jgi:pimeloyl-ACP methyl ester carboxylesterase
MLSALAVALAAAGGCAQIVVHQKPILSREKRDVVETATLAPAGTRRAHALIKTGLELDRKHPGWAVTYFRDAALEALPSVIEGGAGGEGSAEAVDGRGAYRRAIEFLLVTADRRVKTEKVAWTDALSQSGIGVAGKVALYDPALWREVLPTREFQVKGFRRSMARGGVGAPVVIRMAKIVEDRRRVVEGAVDLTDPSERHFPDQLFRSASAVLRPGGPGEPPAVLEFHDPVRDPDMTWSPDGGEPLPLAYDMTIGIARQFHEGNLDLVGGLGVLYPSEYDGKTGIFMMDPYQPGKIPVVFVHGLMSSPAAWTNAINELRGDPELRKRYQFWMFFYSTGNPILTSAARLRSSLISIRDDFDPQAQDPAMDRMVLIGHSMGGVLTRLMVSDSGPTLWQAASDKSPDDVVLADEPRRMLLDSMFFAPVPTVRRAVFVSTPHHGSPMGDAWIGRIASRLIRVPQQVVDIQGALAKLNGGDDVGWDFKDRRYATSVAQLGVANPVLRAIDELPIEPTVPYHSIIGYDGKEPLPAGGDGVVPYLSAHVDGAMSELIVSSGHTAQETEAAIEELRRVLAVHYNEYAADRMALIAGSSPPERPARPEGPTRPRFDDAAADPRVKAKVARDEKPLDLRIIR